MENIVRVIKGNYLDFNAKLETKYSALDGLSIEDFYDNKKSRNSTSKPKNKIKEINHKIIDPKRNKLSMEERMNAKRTQGRGTYATQNSISNSGNASFNSDIISPKSKMNSKSTPKDNRNEYNLGIRTSNTNIYTVEQKLNQSKDRDKLLERPQIDKVKMANVLEKIKGTNQNKNISKTTKRMTTIELASAPLTKSIEFKERDIKKHNTITPSNIDTKKLSNVIKQISMKRTSNNNIGTYQNEPIEGDSGIQKYKVNFEKENWN